MGKRPPGADEYGEHSRHRHAATFLLVAAMTWVFASVAFAATNSLYDFALPAKGLPSTTMPTLQGPRQCVPACVTSILNGRHISLSDVFATPRIPRLGS